MNRFITHPNLPERSVKHALIGAEHEQTREFLSGIGVKTTELNRNYLLDEETRNHADMLASYCGNGKFILSQKDEQVENELIKYGADIITEAGISAPYPHDIALNACFLKDKLVCNINNVSKTLLEHCKKNGITVINTRQGYSKCSVCVVNEKSVITEDLGIASLLKKYQIDVLLLKSGGVYLSDKHTGFIGGSTALIERNRLFFNGDVTKHPQYSEIREFLKLHQTEMIYTNKYKLTDFGGLIPFYE